MMNNNDRNTNRHHRDAIFREEQTDLLSVFEARHSDFDLLEEHPPSHNPDFVAPGSEPWLAGRSTSTGATANSAARRDVAVRDRRRHHHQQHRSSSRSAIIANSFADVNMFDDCSDAAAAPSSSNRNAQSCRNNLFEQIFGCGVGGSWPSSQGAGTGAGTGFNSNATSAGSPFPLAAAAAVAVSDSDDDSTIPFVTALPIDIDGGVGGTNVVNVHENTEYECAYAYASSGLAHEERDIPQMAFSPTSTTTSTTRRVSYESGLESPTPRAAEGRTRSGSRIEERRSPPPDWLNPYGNDITDTSRTIRCNNNRNTSRSLTSRTHFTNWSRISIQARAAAVEVKRSLKKKLVKDVSKKLASSKSLLPRRRR